MHQAWRRSRVARWGGVAWLLVLLLAMIFEEFLIYPAKKYPYGDWNHTAAGKEDAWFTASDGTPLHGWYFHHDAPRGHLLYCHGNGNNVADLGEFAEDLRRRYDLAVFVFDYRGYGRSGGRPVEEGVLADSEAALAWFAKRAEVSPSSVIAMGRSLGGAVAVHLASQVPLRGLVLHSTFASLPDVAAFHYPWLPVRMVMRNRYPSIDKLPRSKCPLLMVHGDADEVVPYASGEELFAAATADCKKFVRQPNGRHNDPFDHQFHDEFRTFLGKPAP